MRQTGGLATGLAVAVGLMVLLDTLRVWLPSVIFVYGRAGSTPATDMAAFGLTPFLLTLLVAVALRFFRPPAVALAGMVVLAGARVALQATAGGDPQLWLSTIGLVGGLAWLVALAGGALAGVSAGFGLAAGLAGDATLHAVLRSTGLAWRDGAGWWIVVVVLAGLAVLLAWQETDDSREPGSGLARGWLAVGPVLFLHALVAGVVSRLHTITGWPEPAAVAFVVGAWALALAAVWWVRPNGRWAALVTVLGAVAALSDPTLLVVVGHVVLPLGLAGVLVVALAGAGTTSSPVRGLAASGGLVVLGALSFVYYAAYDLELGFPNDAAVLVAAVVVGVVAMSVPLRADARTRPPAWAAGPLVLVVIVTAGGVALAADPAEAEPGAGFPVRVVLYNLQMGFDIHGRQALDEQADVIAAERPDLVVLNEVSRGWLINAATDTLPRLADRLGLVGHFSPAADRVWGNALLSRYPVVELRSVELPSEGVAMRRGYVAAVVDLGAGEELGIIGTHLTHVAEGADIRAAQIRALVEEVRRLSAGGRPVALVGDLNAQPGDRELEALDELLEDVSAPHRPVATHPSWEPRTHIDHVYVTPELSGRDYVVPQSTASDHLPVAVTLLRS